ncbi:response regulator transcription factor [Alteromonas sp. ZYF713]|nr:response regulator transcription factor [Alteromonas sp. ZYF713]
MTRVQSEKLLLVDDDISIREAVSDYLRAHGYDVTSVPNVVNLEAKLREEQWDLIILDLMMPGEDGLSACRRLSDKCPPILILSAMADVIDRVAGLEAGACDYLPKPFEPRELLARIRALLRLTKKKPCINRISTNNQDGTYSFLGWRLLAEDRVLYSPSGQEVSLTYNEMSLLIVLASRPGRLLNRDMLMNLTRGNEADTFDRSVDLAISRLRGKLGKDGGELIETIRGAGYRFRPKGAKY